MQNRKEPEVARKGKEKATTTKSDPKATPDTTKDAEIARKIDEEERQKASLIREQKQIEHSEIRIWPIWSKARITRLALPAANPYWLHLVATQRVFTNVNF